MKKKLQKFFALALVFSMIMSMLTISVGATGSEEYTCGKQEHTHSSACLETVLACGKTQCDKYEHTHSEGEESKCVLHDEHDAKCYNLKCSLDEGLICAKKEHQHGDGCDSKNCTHNPESGEEHICDDACCSKEEYTHDDEACYHYHSAMDAEDGCYELICTLTAEDCELNEHTHDESVCHRHVDDCYVEIVDCGMDVHVHSVMCKVVGKDKTAKWADESMTVADVKLSVPGDVEIKGADIVFVIDKSTCGKYATAELQEMFLKLADAQAQSGADINVAVVQFNYTDHLDIPLTKLTAENAATLLDDIKEYSGGTNMESGLLVAQEILAEDTSVPAENKYVILVSDGLTWIYDDENGNPCTILWESSKGELKAATDGYSETRPGTYLDIPTGYTWDEYWKQIKTWVAADGDNYTFPMIANYHEQAFKDSLKTDAAKAAALTSAEGKNHAVNMDRAMYDAWEVYTEMQAAGYNCYVNLVSTNTKQNGYNFMKMLAGDQKALDFTSIQNSIIHSVSKNSYVEDYIGYSADVNEGYNFDFVTDPESITLTVAGVEYTTAQLETAKEGYDASYTFAAEGKEATFWLDYVKGNGTTEEKFVWTFGEDVSAFYPATLDYQVKLMSKTSVANQRNYIVETNQSATLYPVDSNGTAGTPGAFPDPQLIIPKYKVTYEYIGDVPRSAPDAPDTKYYFAGTRVSVEGDEDYRVTDYVFSGWQDPCNALSNGVMPAHDVTLSSYYLPMNDIVDPPIGIKTDKETTGNDYEVTIAVPGDGEKVKIHDEVILILDGSYSCDEEWDDMKKNIMEIGNAVLGGACRTEMTIISFGMGDNIVAEGIKTVDELAEIMKATLPGQLLYGRSSTNCEVGFTAALKYIESKHDELAEVDVVFISDGGINTDETPRQFDNWAYYCDYYNDLTLAMSAIEFPIRYGNTQPDTFYETFGDKYDGMAASDILKDIYVTNAEKYDAEFFMDYCDKVWAEVYAYSGLTIGKEYPISVVERAFVKFDKEKDTYVQDLFYVSTYKSKSVTYPSCGARTIAAAEALADCVKVDELYLVRYANHGGGWWMDDVENGKNYIQATDVAGLLEVIGPMTEELAQTNYTNVVITDYMSKWVLLHTDSISIVNDSVVNADGSKGETIWTITDGWLIDEADRPTTKNPPVVVELVAPEDYDDGGVDVIGNKNGDIYKLTWYVKDDCLLRTDNYSLHYNVTVDVEEEGFIPGIEYPANGNTYVDFEKDGHNEIQVPNVTIPAYTVTYIDSNGNVILHQATNLATGTVIPGCENPADYTNNGYTYRFTGWRLIRGTEGENNTVGTTDLVYLSEYETDDPNPPAPPAPPSGGENPPSGGGNGGGGGSTIIIPEDPTPLNPAPELEEILDEEVPLAPADDLMEIPEEEIPLADIPKTGDASALWMLMSALSGTSLAGVTFLGRKKREEI